LTAHRLPSFFGIREAVEEGGLMSYGECLRHSYFRTAYYLDQIAKGVNRGSSITTASIVRRSNWSGTRQVRVGRPSTMWSVRPTSRRKVCINSSATHL
jgi:hypothetical protein